MSAVSESSSKIPRTISANVRSIVAFNDDTFRVQLRLPNVDAALFFAGQYLFVVMPDGERKPFSIASAPAHSPDLELHIRVMAQHDAAFDVLKHLQACSEIKLELPYGQAILQARDNPILMVAGGTGIAPMLAIIDQLIFEKSNRPVYLYWGARELPQLHCHGEMLHRAQQYAALHYHPVLAAPNSAWHGAIGFPHQLALQQHPNVADYDIYIGGSLAMAKAVSAACLAQQARVQNIFCDLLDLEHEGLLP